MTMLELRMLFFEDLSVGMTETLSKTIDSSDVVGFAEVTGDRNPIHLSEHFAAKTPFGTRIAHGLYTASLISAVLGTRLPGPGAIYISQTLNFRAPVKIGDTVEVSVAVAELMPEKIRARLTCTCAVDGETVLDGEAWVKVPSKEDRRPAAAARVNVAKGWASINAALAAIKAGHGNCILSVGNIPWGRVMPLPFGNSRSKSSDPVAWMQQVRQLIG